MDYRLLLVDGHGDARAWPLRIRTLREFPGLDGLSVHFRPVRNDLLFQSAKAGGRIAHRILAGEGIVRTQLWVEYEVQGPVVNVTGRSSDLLFALALLTAKWSRSEHRGLIVAATGLIDAEGGIGSVERTAEKVAAAVRDIGAAAPAMVFYPAADRSAVDRWRAAAELPPNVRLHAVAHVEEALAHLGYVLARVYLRNPFRGLAHFDYEHHAIFFGRDREVREVVQQLLRREAAGVPGVLIEGASGSGKSSFLRAGVLPALINQRFQADEVQAAIRSQPFSAAAYRAIWRPGELPCGADESKLVASIRQCWAALPEFARVLETAPATLEALAAWRRDLWPATQRFLWFIDQFEELFTLGWTDDSIEALGRFFAQVQSDGVWTLVSVRADALPQLKRYDSLRKVFGTDEGQYYLASLGGTELDAVIALPAKAADLHFGLTTDGKPLEQRLRNDAYRERDSLPLLQFTLNELYQQRNGKELTFAAYEGLGGLAGSIATTAEAVLSAGGVEAEHAAPRLFRSLVSVDERGHAIRRYAPMSDLTGDPAQSRLLSLLVAARLCVTDQRDGQAVAAFAHDTLLQTLPALTEWLKREAGLLQTRELAQREAHLWERHERSDAWLATSDKLGALETLPEAGILLTDSVRAFIARSGQRARRAKRLRRLAAVAVATLGVGVVIGAVAAAVQARRAAEASAMTARRGEFLESMLQSADPRLGGRDITVAQLLDASAQKVESLVAKEPLVAAKLLGIIAETDHGLARYEEGLKANSRQLALILANAAPAEDIANIYVERANLLHEMGRTQEAEAPAREAVRLLAGRRGSEENYGYALDILGRVLSNTGQEKDAETILKEEIRVDRAHFGNGDALPANAFTNLGVLYGNQARYAESAQMTREALAIQKRTLPPDHPDLLITEFNYAVTLENDHQYGAAEPVLREVIAARLHTLGPGHKETLLTQAELGANLYDQQRYQEAVATVLPTIDGLTRALGGDHPYSLYARMTYGRAACAAGQGDAGLEALRAVEATRVRLAGDHSRLLGTRIAIGACLVSLHRYLEAEPLLVEATKAMESERGPRASMTQAGYTALRDLFDQTGRRAEAGNWQSKILPPKSGAL